MTIKILLDTDIGSDIDDAICLAYLLGQKEAEIVGVTTVSGEPVKRAMMVSAQCYVAGKTIPIYPGTELPLLVNPQQPKAPQAQALSNWKHDTRFPEGEAIEFMRRTIRENPHEITLLAIGPLTNVALLFASDPEIPSLLKSLVLMNGYFFGDKKFPEWNVRLDPHASEIVYRANVSNFYSIGLDVTTQVQMDAQEVRSRFDTPLLHPVLDFAEVWFRERPTITFHDPLAATVIFDESICTFESGKAEVEYDNSALPGMTNWKSSQDGKHQIATIVNPAKFFEHFFSVFDQ